MHLFPAKGTKGRVDDVDDGRGERGRSHSKPIISLSRKTSTGSSHRSDDSTLSFGSSSREHIMHMLPSRKSRTKERDVDDTGGDQSIRRRSRSRTRTEHPADGLERSQSKSKHTSGRDQPVDDHGRRGRSQSKTRSQKSGRDQSVSSRQPRRESDESSSKEYRSVNMSRMSRSNDEMMKVMSVFTEVDDRRSTRGRSRSGDRMMVVTKMDDGYDGRKQRDRSRSSSIMSRGSVGPKCISPVQEAEAAPPVKSRRERSSSKSRTRSRSRDSVSALVQEVAAFRAESHQTGNGGDMVCRPHIGWDDDFEEAEMHAMMLSAKPDDGKSSSRSRSSGSKASSNPDRTIRKMPPPPPPPREAGFPLPSSSRSQRESSLPPESSRRRREPSLPPESSRRGREPSLPPESSRRGREPSLPPQSSRRDRVPSLPPESSRRGRDSSLPPESSRRNRDSSQPPESSRRGRDSSIPPESSRRNRESSLSRKHHDRSEPRSHQRNQQNQEVSELSMSMSMNRSSRSHNSSSSISASSSRSKNIIPRDLAELVPTPSARSRSKSSAHEELVPSRSSRSRSKSSNRDESRSVHSQISARSRKSASSSKSCPVNYGTASDMAKQIANMKASKVDDDICLTVPTFKSGSVNLQGSVSNSFDSSMTSRGSEVSLSDMSACSGSDRSRASTVSTRRVQFTECTKPGKAVNPHDGSSNSLDSNNSNDSQNSTLSFEELLFELFGSQAKAEEEESNTEDDMSTNSASVEGPPMRYDRAPPTEEYQPTSPVSPRSGYYKKNSCDSRESLDVSLPSMAGSSTSTSSDPKKQQSSSVCSRDRKAHHALRMARDLVSEATDYSKRRHGYDPGD